MGVTGPRNIMNVIAWWPWPLTFTCHLILSLRYDLEWEKCVVWLVTVRQNAACDQRFLFCEQYRIDHVNNNKVTVNGSVDGVTHHNAFHIRSQNIILVISNFISGPWPAVDSLHTVAFTIHLLCDEMSLKAALKEHAGSPNEICHMLLAQWRNLYNFGFRGPIFTI